jgi:hypothetical protein
MDNIECDYIRNKILEEYLILPRRMFFTWLTSAPLLNRIKKQNDGRETGLHPNYLMVTPPMIYVIKGSVYLTKQNSAMWIA